MEIRATVLHQGGRDEIANELGQTDGYRQGASAMSRDEDRIKARVAGAIDRAKAREEERKVEDGSYKLALPAAVIVDLVVEVKKAKQDIAALETELASRRKTLEALEHLGRVYGPKGGGV